MAATVQQYVADLTQKAAKDLEDAYLNIPVDKRSWSPLDKERSASDQVAECAMLALRTSQTLTSKSFGNIDFEQYFKDKAILAQKESELIPLLQQNSVTLVDVMKQINDNDMDLSIDAPWGPMQVSDILRYPFWNFSYHLGQINYIASLLGCLK